MTGERARRPARCGSELRLTDVNGALVARYVYLCSGRWLAIKNGEGWALSQGRLRNGTMCSDWRVIVEDWLSYITAADRDPRLAWRVEGSGPDDQYYGLMLLPELDLSSIAGLLGLELAELREYLGGFALIGRKP